MTELCDGGCGEKGAHEVVYCIKCNERLDPCDECPNPIEYSTKENTDTGDWICEVCFNLYSVLKLLKQYLYMD